MTTISHEAQAGEAWQSWRRPLLPLGAAVAAGPGSRSEMQAPGLGLGLLRRICTEAHSG